MIQFVYVIKDENGIHARPAGLLAKEAQKYSAEITLEAKGKTASVKKLFALMGMGVKKGDEVTVTVDGADENEIAVSLKEFFNNNF